MDVADGAVESVRKQCWSRWPTPPESDVTALDAMFTPLLQQAAEATAETLLVTNPTSRPRRLQLAVICDDRSLDAMYHQEWCELSIAANGLLLLIYRRRDGDDYAVSWDAAVTLPSTLLPQVPDELAVALFDEPR